MHLIWVRRRNRPAFNGLGERVVVPEAHQVDGVRVGIQQQRIQAQRACGRGLAGQSQVGVGYMVRGSGRCCSASVSARKSLHDKGRGPLPWRTGSTYASSVNNSWRSSNLPALIAVEYLGQQLLDLQPVGDLVEVQHH